MKSRHLFISLGLLLGMLFTTGIILPWVISNVIMPLWMIVFCLMGIIALWVMLLERPYRRLVNLLLRSARRAPNVD